MEEFKYGAPTPGSYEREHSFSIEVDGKPVVEALVHENNDPFPFYSLYHMGVQKQFENQGYASKIVDAIEKFLKEKKMPGVLADVISEKSPARGMYARRGWVPLPGSPKMLSLHAFNLPEGADIPALVAKLSER